MNDELNEWMNGRVKVMKDKMTCELKKKDG